VVVERDALSEWSQRHDGYDVQQSRLVRAWLGAYKRGEAPSSSGMPWLTWDQSARGLLGAVLGRPEYQTTIIDQQESQGK